MADRFVYQGPHGRLRLRDGTYLVRGEATELTGEAAKQASRHPRVALAPGDTGRTRKRRNTAKRSTSPKAASPGAIRKTPATIADVEEAKAVEAKAAKNTTREETL